jgi:hypothetical protein
VTVRADIPDPHTDPTGHAIWIAVYAAVLGASLGRWSAEDMAGAGAMYDAAIEAANRAVTHARLDQSR